MTTTAVRLAASAPFRRGDPVPSMKVKLFADGADRTEMLNMYSNDWIQGFTTNPTLMRKAGIKDYEVFARDILGCIPDRPISLEVFADDFREMERQARKIASWGPNVFVKIPITNTRGESSVPLVRRLSEGGIRVNITALMTLQQVLAVSAVIEMGVPAYVSVFAGRIADTGRNPLPIMSAAVEILKCAPNVELIWASPRELLNVLEANTVGCHIITASRDIINKLSLLNRDLSDYSLETVRMFHADARASGFDI